MPHNTARNGVNPTDAKFITSAPRNVGRMRDSEEGCPQMLFVGGECEKKKITIK